MAGIEMAKKQVVGLLGLGLIAIVYLVIFGNLSGNLGFASGTAGYNSTQAAIGNVTSGVTSLMAFTPTLFTIVGVVLLIAIIFTVVKVASGKKSESGFSN